MKERDMNPFLCCWKMKTENAVLVHVSNAFLSRLKTNTAPVLAVIQLDRAFSTPHKQLSTPNAEQIKAICDIILTHIYFWKGCINMKKLIAMMLMLMLALSLCACGKGKSEESVQISPADTYSNSVKKIVQENPELAEYSMTELEKENPDDNLYVAEAFVGGKSIGHISVRFDDQQVSEFLYIFAADGPKAGEL